MVIWRFPKQYGNLCTSAAHGDQRNRIPPQFPVSALDIQSNNNFGSTTQFKQFSFIC